MSTYLLRKLAIAYVLHDDAGHVVSSIENLREFAPVFAFVSRTPWEGHLRGDWQSAAEKAHSVGAEVVAGDWSTKIRCEKAARVHLMERGFKGVYVPHFNIDLDLGILSAMVMSTTDRPVITTYVYDPSGQFFSTVYLTGYVAKAPRYGY